MSKDYYKALGIEKQSSKEDIKQAFRKLAHKYHPDKAGGDTEKFKEINEAYSVLSDDKKRAEYDQYGRVFSGGTNAGAGGFGQDFGGFDFSSFARNGSGNGFEFDMGDLFGDFFGGGQQQRKRGRDISMDLELSFEEAIFGVERTMLINKVAKCESCKGSGGEPGSLEKKCGTCNGEGHIREVKRTFMGSVAVQKICDTCHGTGNTFEKHCKTCHGAGVRKRDQEIKVKIPAGIEDGEMIRLSQAGEAVSGGIPGDLYIKVHVEKHSRIKKDGTDLTMDLNIKLTDALLGSEYSIETLDGLIMLKVPAGVAHNELLRIRGKGVPKDGSGRGDFLVRIKIELPQKLNKKAKKLIEDLREEGI